ncbi:MAG: hypothetical protein Q4G43_11060 [Mobilicoccus sp.]|nr:hypothetical protein [Mobilicoccus sp.]
MTITTVARFAAGVAVGAAAALALPRGEDDGQSAAPLDLPPGARAVVATGSELPTWALAALGGATGLAAAQAVGTRRLADVAGAGLAGATTVALRRIDVLVDDRGLTLVSGLPGVRVTVAPEYLRSARAATVTAAEFGGLGLRWSARRGAGLILRPGPALTVETVRGTLTISADDPQRAAALLTRTLEAHT